MKSVVLLSMMFLCLCVPLIEAQTILGYDGFEDYSPGSSPSPPWHESYTVGVSVDNQEASSGTNSLRIYSSPIDCDNPSIASRYFAPLEYPIVIEMEVQNGSETLSGCEPMSARALVGMGMFPGNPNNLPLFFFLENGDLVIPTIETTPEDWPTVSGFNLNEWYYIKIEASAPGDGLVHKRYWADGDFLGEYTESWADDLSYLSVASVQGTVWFDDVFVQCGNPPPEWQSGLDCLTNLHSCLLHFGGFLASFVPCLDALPAAISVPNGLCEAMERQQEGDEIGSAIAQILTSTTIASVIGSCSLIGYAPSLILSALSALGGCVDALIQELGDIYCPGEPAYTCLWEGLSEISEDVLSVFTGSPVNIRIIDENGNEMGFNENDSLFTDLPNPSWIWQLQQEQQLAIVRDPSGIFTVNIEGTPEAGSGSDINIGLFNPKPNGIYDIVFYEQILMTSNAVASVNLSETTSDYILAMDLENDGIIDVYINPDSIITLGSGSIIGHVVSNSMGIFGTPVDLIESGGVLYAAATTDDSGYCEFANIPNGGYTVSISTPLGYSAENESQDITIAGIDLTVNFSLTPIETVGERRGLGFWKHQVNVYVSGRGHAQIPQGEFCGYLADIGTHFNNNPVNSIALYVVDQPATQTDSLEAAASILSVHGNVPMAERAKQHLMALLLNVTSLRLHQQEIISEDSATASQAITYCWSLITDGDDSNDELAKDIADQINNNIWVNAGVIPLDTPNISYKIEEEMQIPTGYSLPQNYPNPFNASTTIKYGLPKSSQVTVEIYDIMGRKVETVFDGLQPAGYHSVIWNSGDNSSGVYFYNIQAGAFIETRKMVLLK